MGRLTGKVILVTGAGAGIGRAIAIQAATEGALVTVADIDASACAAVAAEITGQGHAAQAQPLDVTDPFRWTEVTDGIVATHGRLDGLVNNAGIQLSRPLLDTTLDDLRRVFAVNLEGTFLGTQAAMRVMREAGQGAIVNMSSTLASHPLALNAAYCASKAAVTQLSKVAALEGATSEARIRVNTIHPGVIATPMVDREIADVTRERGLSSDAEVRAEWHRLCPLGIGQPADIAHGAVYLLSDEAAYVTGTELAIDGGHLLT